MGVAARAARGRERSAVRDHAQRRGKRLRRCVQADPEQAGREVDRDDPVQFQRIAQPRQEPDEHRHRPDRRDFYGSTLAGGSCANCLGGVAYELVEPPNKRPPWTETLLYQFTGGQGGATTDGSEPEGRPLASDG